MTTEAEISDSESINIDDWDEAVQGEDISDETEPETNNEVDHIESIATETEAKKIKLKTKRGKTKAKERKAMLHSKDLEDKENHYNSTYDQVETGKLNNNASKLSSKKKRQRKMKRIGNKAVKKDKYITTKSAKVEDGEPKVKRRKLKTSDEEKQTQNNVIPEELMNKEASGVESDDEGSVSSDHPGHDVWDSIVNADNEETEETSASADADETQDFSEGNGSHEPKIPKKLKDKKIKTKREREANVKSLQCPECPHMFTFQSQLKQHLCRHKAKDILSLYRRSFDTSDKDECLICEKKYGGVSYLVVHLGVKHGYLQKVKDTEL